MLNKLIIANWKMNGSIAKIVEDLKLYSHNLATNRDNIILALPLPFLDRASQISANFVLASQDISRFKDFGAYTGEISTRMLNDFNLKYVIIGHSERRLHVSEDDEILKNKLENVLDAQITPIFCIGESIANRQSGDYIKFLHKQLEVLVGLRDKLEQLVIAYEPIWSIGTGIVPSPEQIVEVIESIYSFVQKNLSHVKITTLYGGSVTSSNIKQILQIDCVGGVLVGGSSLKVDEFIKICEMA